jgi:hypothetical protein
MSAADLPSFLASSPLAERSLDTWDRRVILGPDHEFWDPESVPTLRTAETIYPGARGFRIGVDERTPGVVVVYLIDHGT